jgi:tetratricopeptide (TPR) repeat protein
VHRGLLRSTGQGFALEDGVQLTFPDDLLDVWTERLAGATASASLEEVQALQLAAALGRDVGREEWILVCAQEGFVVPFGLIGRLADIGIVREQEGGFRFAHDLARDAVVRRSREEGSWASHASRCADAIASLGNPGSAERCALLLLDAGRIEDAAAAYLRAAVWVGELGDDHHSIELYTAHAALLDRLGAEPEDERRIEAGLRALERKRSYGQYDVLVKEAQRFGAVARQQSWRSLEALALYLEAMGRRSLEGDSASIPPLERAVELFDEADPEDAGIRTRLLLGRVLSTSGQFERAEAETRRALADAERWGSPLSQSRALLRMADVLNMVGKAEEAEEPLEKALDLVGRYGLLRAEIRVRIIAAGSMVRLGKTDEAAAHISRARDLAVRLGHKGDISDACTLQGEVERMRGNLALAEDAYREALRLSTELKSGWVAAPRSNLGLIRLQLGLYEEARALLEEARGEFLDAGRRGLGDFLACLLLPCYAALGDWGAWTDIWPAIARFAPGTSLAELDSACLLVQAAELALRAGEAERGQAAGQMAVLHYRALGRAAEAKLLAVRYGLEQSESTDS